MAYVLFHCAAGPSEGVCAVCAAQPGGISFKTEPCNPRGQPPLWLPPAGTLEYHCLSTVNRVELHIIILLPGAVQPAPLHAAAPSQHRVPPPHQVCSLSRASLLSLFHNENDSQAVLSNKKARKGGDEEVSG